MIWRPTQRKYENIYRIKKYISNIKILNKKKGPQGNNSTKTKPFLRLRLGKQQKKVLLLMAMPLRLNPPSPLELNGR